MAKQVLSYYVELKDTGTEGMKVRYVINDSVDAKLKYSDELDHTITESKTITETRADVLAAIKTKEGIA